MDRGREPAEGGKPHVDVLVSSGGRDGTGRIWREWGELAVRPRLLFGVDLVCEAPVRRAATAGVARSAGWRPALDRCRRDGNVTGEAVKRRPSAPRPLRVSRYGLAHLGFTEHLHLRMGVSVDVFKALHCNCNWVSTLLIPYLTYYIQLY